MQKLLLFFIFIASCTTCMAVIHVEADLSPENVNNLLLSSATVDYPEWVGRLIKVGANLNHKNSNGLTALMIAAALHNHQFTNELLRNNALVDEKDSMGWTAFMWAMASYTKQEISQTLELLKKHGTQETHEDSYKKSALYYQGKLIFPDITQKNPQRKIQELLIKRAELFQQKQ